MSEQQISHTVTVINDQGLHMRPADTLVQFAKNFAAQVVLVRGGDRFDAKSILDVMALGAEKGSVLRLEATGEDAEDAVRTLVEAFRTGFTGSTSSAGDEQPR